MSSLDDFFAKKDKKRGKGKSVLTPDALVKELEEGAVKPDYHIRKDNKTTGVGIEILGLDADDADWKDFEDVDKRDYTGLKIQTMSLEDQEEELRRIQAAERRETDQEVAWKPAVQTNTVATATATATANVSGETPAQGNQPANNLATTDDKSSDLTNNSCVESTNASTTPDATGSTTTESSKNAAGTSESTTPSSDQAPAEPVKYVPPQQRNRPTPEPGALQRTVRGMGPVGRRNKDATPDLSSNELFPTLS